MGRLSPEKSARDHRKHVEIIAALQVEITCIRQKEFEQGGFTYLPCTKHHHDRKATQQFEDVFLNISVFNMHISKYE